jgi:tetratricopeptide (TPR) repeat protein
MARRRLNKKVALMGTTVLLLLVMMVMFVFLRLNRDPAPLIADGDAAWAAKNYPAARENYARAYALVESPEMKVDLLFKLSEAYREMAQWDKVLGCWEAVVTTDPQNVKAHLGRLKYAYILADSLGIAGRSVSGYWEEVLTHARKTLDVVKAAGLLDAARAQWEPSFGAVRDRGWSRGAAVLGPHLHLVKGRAAMELAGMGAVASPGRLLQEAQVDLEEANKLDANNAQVYYYLSQVFAVRGRIAASVGSRNEQAQAEKQADEILAEGLRAAGESPEAHIHALARKLAVVQRGTIAEARARMKDIESQYDDLTRRFASSPQAYAAKAQFLSFFAAYLDAASARDKLDKAIAAAQQAGSLDPNSAEYAVLAASYQYRKSSIYEDASAQQAAIDLADKALQLSDAQNTPGPTQTARQVNRLSLCALLARGCIERILSLPALDPAREGLLARAEEAVRQIKQIQGSGENPQVLTWQGMLDLAKGEPGKAVTSLYAAYERIKAANAPEQRDPYLSLTLASIFKETSETGAVIDFLGTALSSGIIQTKPDALLDYGDALMMAGSYDGTIGAVASFEERFGANERSRTLRIKALIAGGQVSEAEQAVSQLQLDGSAALLLNLDLVRAKTTQLLAAIHQERTAGGVLPVARPDGRDQPDAARAMTADLLNHHRREADLTQQLLAADPNALEERHLVRLCESLIEQGDLGTAKTVADAYLKQSPDSPGALFYGALLLEPDPRNCPQAQRTQIQGRALGAIRDPVRRALELGAFYRQSEQLDQAAAQWRSVLDATTSQGAQDMPAYLKIRNISPRHMAAGNLFDLARHREDWKSAEEIVDLAKRENLDDCTGSLYAARLAFARQQYDAALAHLDKCLKQRPIFSHGYMLRGNVKAALGRERESVDDIREASRLNPMDPVVAKSLANALYVRNNKLGVGASSEQRLEARQALERAIHLNPRDVNLLSAYADLIGDDDSTKAIAIRQTIQTNAPTLQNAVMLGRLATQTAQKETDEQKKKAFFAVAEAAFEQARQMNPSDQSVLDSYAAYFRAVGKNEKARQLLVESNDSRLLWRHYFRVRDFAQAKRLLTKMYAESGSRVDALKGLLLVAEETGDRQGVTTHSAELISLDDSAVNRLAQLRAYLNVGLVGEAEQKLESFKQKYPGQSNAVLLEAQVAKRQGQLKRAMDLVNRGLETNQRNAAAWQLRGEISLLMGDEDRAILDFRKSREIEDNPVAAIGLAKAYLWAGRNDEAIAELRRAAGRPEAPLEAMTLLEATYRKLGRADALQQLYAGALAESPDSVFWLNRAGSFALDQRQHDQAEEFFRKAMELRGQGSAGQGAAGLAPDAEYSAALDGYFRSLILGAGDPAAGSGWRPERLDRVFQEGNRYVETPYAPVAFFRMAEAKKKLGDATAAGDFSRQAADKAWANQRLAVEILLRVYLLLGEEEVSAYCRRRLATEPDSLAANFVLFSLAQVQDQYGQAIGYIDKCIRLSGPDTEAGVEYTIRKADLLTVAHKKTSDKTYLQQAIAVYESLLAKMPKNSSVLNNLAYMLAQNDQRLDEALGYARTAVEQSPEVAGHQDTYAYVLYKNGRPAEAAEALAAAIQRYEADGAVPVEVYEHLGMVNEALGQKSKARAAYRRALEAGGDGTPDVVKQRISSAIQRLQ